MEERKISKYDLSMHLVDSECAAICQLLMPGATVFQVSNQGSGTSTVNIKILTRGGKSHSFDLAEM